MEYSGHMGNMFAGAFFLFYFLFIIALLVLVVWSIIDIVRSEVWDKPFKALWVLAVYVTPIVGPILWFMFGRKGSNLLNKPTETVLINETVYNPISVKEETVMKEEANPSE